MSTPTSTNVIYALALTELNFREIDAHEQADITATFSTDSYAPAASTPPMTGQIPVRVHLVEDRVIPIERKFFCDRATEKTVTLTVGSRCHEQS